MKRIAQAALILFAGCSAAPASPAPPDRANPLIVELASEDPHQRDQAYAALLDVGDDVERELQREKNHPDPEVRARIVALLAEIESRRQIRAIRPNPHVTLDIKDLPVAEAVDRISTAYGTLIHLDKDLQQRVSFSLKNATLWEALATLCKEADLVDISFDQPIPSLTSREDAPWSSASVHREDTQVFGTFSKGTLIVIVRLPSGTLPQGMTVTDLRASDGSGKRLDDGITNIPHVFGSRIRRSYAPLDVCTWEDVVSGDFKGVESKDLSALRIEGTVSVLFPERAERHELLLVDGMNPKQLTIDGIELTATERSFEAKDPFHEKHEPRRFAAWIEDEHGSRLLDLILPCRLIGRGRGLKAGIEWGEALPARKLVILRCFGERAVRVPFVLDLPVKEE